MRLASLSRVKYLDLGDAESSLPLVAVLIDGLQDAKWELIHESTPDHPLTHAQAHLNGLKYTVHCGVTLGLGPRVQDVHVHVAQRFPFQPSPSADIPKSGLL